MQLCSSNPPQRYSPTICEWIDTPPDQKLKVFEEDAKSILSTNDSPDIGFEFSVNPYRGCFHGCAYCYARPTHQYIDFGAGTDFERKIVAKVNAAERLKEAFEKKSWKGGTIVFSGVTDCYQPLEAHYELTRKCLQVCADYKNPVAIITKGALVRRDIDVLSRLAREAKVRVNMSIAFADDEISKLVEPGAPRPSIRFKAMKALSEAGIPVGVGIAPVIPGLNDHEISEILERARDAGADRSFMTLLRLPAEVKEVFSQRLNEAFPTRAQKVLAQLRDMKFGSLNRSEFGKRMTGEGPRWDAIQWMYAQQCEKLGLNAAGGSGGTKSTFRRPSRQLALIE